MKIIPLKPRQFLSPLYAKKSITSDELENFEKNLSIYLDHLKDQLSRKQTESDIVTNVLKPFFESLGYSAQSYAQKGQSGIDLALMQENKPAVIIEAKMPESSDMITAEDPNKKALHEAVLYFMRERERGNYAIFHILITDFYRWYIFDAKDFDRLFWQNETIRKIYASIKNPATLGDRTKDFYTRLAKELASWQKSIKAAFIDLCKPINNSQKVALYKLFSKEKLFKSFNPNDANRLNKDFYNELLYIMGLEERKEGGKKIIARAKNPLMASLYENTKRNLEYAGHQADFETVLRLNIIWINRILFLKLLEAQLLKWNGGDARYRFLNIETIEDFDKLKIFFFDILAKAQEDRSHKEYPNIPYLNSSLFEIAPIEKRTIDISNLEDNCRLPYYSKTVLRDKRGKRRVGDCNMLQYLFEFLDAYDFSGEGSEEIVEKSKTLINAAVLGLIFEKLNGYKEGSYYTPSFVTMYMAREAIEKAVIEKFNRIKGWKCESLDDLYEKIDDKKEANAIIDSLTICDPAVGSGHFLVSALNTILAIKSELRLLYDADGKRIKDYTLEVENDELIVRDDEGEVFEYRRGSKECSRIQRAIFEEKKRIIENCLFGVDINPNAANIARLRLWIELLKHSYYDENDKLVTMPNIDVNVKVGNSLISRYGLHDEITIQNIIYEIDEYKKLVRQYKEGAFATTKEEMKRVIEKIKAQFGLTLQKQWKQMQNYKKLLKEYVKEFGLEGLDRDMQLDALDFRYGLHGRLFDEEIDGKRKELQRRKLLKKLQETRRQIEEIRSGRIYENAFEWRFEFPEVLDEEGNFVGFDVLIGNPPYISLSKIKDIDYGNLGYQTYDKSGDILALFVERSLQITHDHGIVSLITSNSWLKTRYGEPLKRELQKYSTQILNFEDTQIFSEATVETCIVNVFKGGDATFQTIDIKRFDTKNATIESLRQKIEHSSHSGMKEDKLMRRIQERGQPLGEWDVTIYRGVTTGYNKAFIIDTSTKERLVRQDPKSAELLRPLIRGRDVQRYAIHWAGLWLITTFPASHISINEYPAIKSYLESFGKRLEQSGEKGSRKKTNHAWFETQDSIAYWKEFEKPKIVWGEIADAPKFAYDESGLYGNDKIFIMTGKNLKYLLAILNSKLSQWYFSKIAVTSGQGTILWKKYKLQQLPIPQIQDTQSFEKLVDQIIAKKRAGESTQELEAKIDQMLYDLYDLSEEEIRIVESI